MSCDKPLLDLCHHRRALNGGGGDWLYFINMNDMIFLEFREVMR